MREQRVGKRARLMMGDSFKYEWPVVEDGLLILDPNFEDWETVACHPAVNALGQGFIITFSRFPDTVRVYAALSERFTFRDHITWHDPQCSWVSNDLVLKTTEDVLVFRVGNAKSNMKVGDTQATEAQAKGKSAIGRWSQGERHYKPSERKHLTSLLSIPRDLSAPLGRWQKPDKLAHLLVSAYSNNKTTVLDPFCGSGTFLQAADRLGRSSIGVELSEDHVSACVSRFSQQELF
jgi:hypothetical protein